MYCIYCISSNKIRDKETVDAIEIWAIKKYKPEYNIAKGGSGGITQDMIEFNRNPEIVKKRVETYKKNHPKLSEAKKGCKAWNKGVRATPEQIEKNREAQKKYWSTHTNPNKGR